MMSDADSTTMALPAEDTGASGPKTPPPPMDSTALLELAITARQLADSLQKGLRQIAPRLTLEQLAALRAMADAGTEGQTLGAHRSATMLAALADIGLVTLSEKAGTALLTRAGRDTLEQTDILMSGITATMNERPKPIGGRAIKVVNQAVRMLRGYLRDHPVEGTELKTMRKRARHASAQ